MRIAVLTLGLACAGCGTSERPPVLAPTPTATTPTTTPTSTPTTPPSPTPVPEAASPDYYSDAELTARGLQVAPASSRPTRETFGPDGPAPTISGYDFLCGGADRARCVCRQPLPCTARGDCFTLESNLEGFRQALRSTGDRQVGCERGEVGHCGTFRYFYFQGDIHRYEMRWFDASGRIVAQRNTTDYNEYCNGAAMAQWLGRVPKCDALVRDELICGSAPSPLRTPIDDLRALAGL